MLSPQELQKSPAEFYYSQILLYFPWREEEELFNLHWYEDFYNIHIDTIDETRSEFEHYSDIIDNAIEEFEAHGAPLH